MTLLTKSLLAILLPMLLVVFAVERATSTQSLSLAAIALTMIVAYGLWVYLYFKHMVSNKISKLLNLVSTQEDSQVALAQANNEDEIGQLSVAVHSTLQQLNALSNLQDEVQKRTTKMEAVHWIQSSKSTLNEAIQGEQDLVELAQNILKQLSTILNIQVGALYGLASEVQTLKLLATYAYPKSKSKTQTLRFGEGLVGQAAIDQKLIVVSDLPDNYVQVSSSFGEATPRNLVILPIKIGDGLNGVLELAAFEPFKEIHIDFLEQVQETIGLSLYAAESRVEMQVLLTQFEIQREEIAEANELLEEQNQQLEHQGEVIQEQNQELEKAKEVLEERIEERTRELRLRSEELEQFNDKLQQFVPDKFLKILHKKNIIDVNPGDHVEKRMTVFFSDIRFFTSLSESMTPSENFRFINSYLSFMAPIIKDKNGIIDKYIGDAIMALFDNPDDAVRAAIAMSEMLLTYNQYRAKCGYVPIKLGFGINTGDLMLGTVGGEIRMDSTVIGDTVNLTARIEHLTKTYETPILIGSDTFIGLQNNISYSLRYIDCVVVRGKSENVMLYEVIDGDLPERQKKKLQTLPMYEKGINAYQTEAYIEALRFFEKCYEIDPDDVVIQIYRQRCYGHLGEIPRPALAS
ncbi:adenylate/guanylate cyclase domain-containing protein [Litoribrevibacter euphylliae]|uniref:Adenylate/guanylate cyclase domain-containing protein n=1 Tax=Litoribrevibacter euphylliae TaxID=1834034 RepID=A0ABV7HHZ3_9GAMM